jgi:hypothetical protein
VVILGKIEDQQVLAPCPNNSTSQLHGMMPLQPLPVVAFVPSPEQRVARTSWSYDNGAGSRDSNQVDRRKPLKSTTGMILGLFASSALALWSVSPIYASGQGGGAQITTFDATGATFSCSTGVTYTVLGGTVRSVFHDSFDATGGEHVTGTTVPNGVTLSDGTTSTIYRLSGATWFGGSFLSNGQFVFTDTGHFNIIGSNGGVVARVSTVEHMSSNGSNFSFDFGQCTAPSD